MKSSRRDARLRLVLRMVRVGAGMTAEELANEVNMDRSYISRVESGRVPVNSELIVDWLDACGGRSLLSWAIESFQAMQTLTDLFDSDRAAYA